MLGLDLGTFSIKAVQVRKSRSGYQVERFAEVPTPPQAIAGGQVIPGPPLVEALKELQKKLGGGTRDVAVGIPANLALVRRLNMPKVPVKKLRELLESQGHQFIPFFRDGATFDFVVTNPNASATEQEILLVAVPTMVVERLQAALRAAGFKLIAVDVDMVALYRAGLALGEIPQGVAAAVLEVGHRRARIGLFHNGWPTITRTVDVLPLLPAEIEPPADARFLDPEEFAVEVRRTMEIMLSQSKPDERIGAALVSGRWQAPEMFALLDEELRTGGRTSPEFRTVSLPTQTVAAGLALAFGLSLAQEEAPARLRLLPRPPMDVQKQRRTAVLVLILAILGAGAYGYFWYEQRLQLQADTEQLNKAMAEHNAFIAKTEAEVAAIEARIRDFEPLRTAMDVAPTWSTFYPHLRTLLPADVTLQNVAVSGNSLTISGKAGSPEGLADFVQKLHTSPMVTPPLLHTYTESGGAFNITGKVRPRSAGGAK